MAKAWWEAEIRILERRKACIDAEQQVLEDGGATWQQVMTLVTDFESNLRGITKTGTHSNATRLDKDKENVPSQEELIRGQLSRMNEIVAELGQHMQLAESKRWNLLICAIGAELEAFKEAHSVLKAIIDGASGGIVEHTLKDPRGAAPK
ncbi:autophagy-related protein 28 [Lasius niger]|uniref:Autophagy-related protein 28 n=1 Tax=Lasius niger TaxID=67767 RepID=A0A0J7MLM1_LASNI|nr:autophagy-related protein 28 [Lasius niger]